VKILHIDDHEMFREGMVSYLQSLRPEWEILSCESVEKAQIIFESEKIDLVLTDLNLPGAGLPELKDYLSKQLQSLPVVVLSMDSGLKTLKML